MSYGKMTVVCGPMYAGKTTEMLKRVLWARNGQNREVVVLKPAFDNRYAETQIVSHDGLRATAESITELPDGVLEAGSLIVLDEIQFFNEPYVSGDLVAWVQDQLSEGVDVVAGGLDMDWRGDPFEVTALLMAMADEVIKVTANCTVCGRAARKTWKKADPLEPLAEEAEDIDLSGKSEEEMARTLTAASERNLVNDVELGAQEKYEARCNEHWVYKDE
jgi:thymidine kinase